MLDPVNEFPWPGGPIDVEPWRDEPGLAGKTPVRTFLRFGIDVDGTISRAPKHFQRLINALVAAGNIVYIVTARDATRREETEQLLASLRIRYHWLVMKPVDWLLTIADYKVQVVLDKDLHLLIDDEAENCWAVELRTAALAVHMLPSPVLPEEFEIEVAGAQLAAGPDWNGC